MVFVAEQKSVALQLVNVEMRSAAAVDKQPLPGTFAVVYKTYFVVVFGKKRMN